MTGAVTVAVEDGIALVTLDRPAARNAVNRDVVDGLLSAFDRIDADDDIRAAVLAGNGPVFCAGADLSAGSGTFDFGGGLDGFRDPGGMLTLRAYRALKPLVAAVGGPAVGLGATMLLPFDLRLAATTARFVFPFTQRGITPEAASTWFLPRLVGPSRAIDWLVSGRAVEAAEALAAGFVDAVVAPEALIEAARQRARALVAGTAPVSAAITRQLVWRNLAAPSPEEAHRRDSRALFLRGSSADAAEGVMAFLQKRPAAFPLTVSADYPAEVFG